jgi:hypothetical protein
MQSIHTQ